MVWFKYLLSGSVWSIGIFLIFISGAWFQKYEELLVPFILSLFGGAALIGAVYLWP